jgi:hypothetical protein
MTLFNTSRVRDYPNQWVHEDTLKRVDFSQPNLLPDINPELREFAIAVQRAIPNSYLLIRSSFGADELIWVAVEGETFCRGRLTYKDYRKERDWEGENEPRFTVTAPSIWSVRRTGIDKHRRQSKILKTAVKIAKETLLPYTEDMNACVEIKEFRLEAIAHFDGLKREWRHTELYEVLDLWDRKKTIWKETLAHLRRTVVPDDRYMHAELQKWEEVYARILEHETLAEDPIFVRPFVSPITKEQQFMVYGTEGTYCYNAETLPEELRAKLAVLEVVGVGDYVHMVGMQCAYKNYYLHNVKSEVCKNV